MRLLTSGGSFVRYQEIDTPSGSGTREVCAPIACQGKTAPFVLHDAEEFQSLSREVFETQPRLRLVLHFS